MSFTSLDILLVLSSLICGLLGVARGAIRQFVSIACCSLGFVLIGFLASPIAKAIGESLASFGRLAPLIWLVLAVLLLIAAAHIVHRTLPTRIGMMDRALGLLLGFVRGFGVVAVPLIFILWVTPTDKQPNYMQNALSFPFLKYVMNVVPSLRPGDLQSRFDVVSGSVWLAIGAAAIPSALVDLLAIATRRGRLRRLDREYGEEAPMMPRDTDARSRTEPPALDSAEAQARLRQVNDCLRPIQRAPSLRTVNSLGWTIVQTYTDPALSPKVFGFYGLQFLALQITVRAIFLVSQPKYNSYLFHGMISKEDFSRIYPGRLLKMRLKSLLTTIAGLGFVIGLVWIYRRLRG